MLRMIWRETVTLVVWSMFISAFGQEPVVVLPQGKLTGFKIYTESRVAVNAFLGIPFASPPVGDLRFAAPERHPGWNRTLFANKYGASCPQLNNPSVPRQSTAAQDENCLFLNVWAPESANSYRRASVVIFLEGEDFVFGSSSRFPGQDLAAEGVVVVTTNYRLNVFGFLCLENAVARGNLGLLDQYFALLWVRENIEAFGGDPLSVTLMGHSSGAASVLYHMVSPRTGGLFQRAIMMSGSGVSQWLRMANPGNSSKAIARSLGCSSTLPRSVLQCLRSKTTADILRAFETQYKNGNWSELTLPVVDDFLPESEQYLPREPAAALESGDFLQLPVLTGTTSHDGIIKLYQWGDLSKQSFKDLRHFFNTTAISNTMEHYDFKPSKREELRAIIQWHYMDQARDKDQLLEQLVAFYTDVHFRAPHEKQILLLARSSQPVYVYSLEQNGSPDLFGNTINISGSAHGSELLFLFAPTIWQVTGRRISPIEDRLSKNIKRIWADFIRQGNPLPGPFSYSFTWKPYTLDDRNVFTIKNNPQRPNTNQIEVENMDRFWNEFLPRIENISSIKSDSSGRENREFQYGSDSSQPFRSAMYTLIGFVTVLLVMLIICLVLLKKRAKERDRDIF